MALLLPGCDPGRWHVRRWGSVRLKDLQARGLRRVTDTVQIYKCQSPSCPPPGCYRSYPSSKEANPKCERAGCDGRMELLR